MSEILPVGEAAEIVVAWVNETFGWLLDAITEAMNILEIGRASCRERV